MGKKKSLKTALIVAGGTGGHVYPALGLARSLSQKGIRVLTAGRPGSFEEKVFKDNGFTFLPFVSYPFSRKKFDWKHLLTILVNLYGFFQMWKWFLKYRFDFIFCFGGYFSIPPFLFSSATKLLSFLFPLLKVPLYIHEQNFYPGVANRLLGRFSEKIFLSYQESERFFPKEKTVYSGNIARFYRRESRELSYNYPLKILVVGGSLGAKILLDTVLDFLENFPDFIEGKYQFTIITGKRFFEEYQKRFLKQKNVNLIPYSDDMLTLYNSHHLVISRGGATTLWELLVLKKPALIVPGDFATEDHQYKNALFLVNLGGAVVLREKEFIPEKLKEFLANFNEERYLQFRENLDKIKVVDSIEKIMSELNILK